MINNSINLALANSLGGGGYYSIEIEPLMLGNTNNSLNCQAL